MVVLVTGALGQLGLALQSIAKQYCDIDFKFFSSSELDITDLKQCIAVFQKINPNFCINAAAYTAVDKAEIETEKARIINVEGPNNLAKVCKAHDTVLIHISTDFVFDGNPSRFEMTNGYTEEDVPNPTGVYGQTKLDGEKAVQSILKKYFIIRTSWVYSEFGNNFMKTMLRLGSERESLSVVNDQIGTPTNAVDLANALLTIVTKNSKLNSDHYGVYNFSNDGQCSWYDFAKKIFEIHNIKIKLKPIVTADFPTLAKRPSYSVLDKIKIKNTFKIAILNWEESLKNVDFSVITEKKP